MIGIAADRGDSTLNSGALNQGVPQGPFHLHSISLSCSIAWLKSVIFIISIPLFTRTISS